MILQAESTQNHPRREKKIAVLPRRVPPRRKKRNIKRARRITKSISQTRRRKGTSARMGAPCIQT
ncbi:hypothetical protein X975_26484, partial [Stegodyphus mimosarum]